MSESRLELIRHMEHDDKKCMTMLRTYIDALFYEIHVFGMSPGLRNTMRQTGLPPAAFDAIFNKSANLMPFHKVPIILPQCCQLSSSFHHAPQSIADECSLTTAN